MLPRSSFRLSCALLAAVAFLGCSDDSTPGPDAPGLEITPLFRGVIEGDTVRLVARLNGQAVPVTWDVQYDSIASVTADGLVTGRLGGFTAVTATSTNPAMTRSASITVIPVPALTSGTGITISGTGARGTAAYRKIIVPAGATRLTVTIGGGTGDVDMAVRHNAVPTLSANNCASENAGNTESCVINNPAAGTWFILLYLWDPYAGATLTATVTP